VCGAPTATAWTGDFSRTHTRQVANNRPERSTDRNRELVKSPLINQANRAFFYALRMNPPAVKKKPQGPQTLAQKFAHWKELVAKLEEIIPADHPFSAFPEIKKKGWKLYWTR
jgi:hypothetical protein